MSSKLMDTEPGGESTQYESISTVEKPHSKQGGQMGEPQTTSQKTTTTADDVAQKGARTAENIRYGQTISEGGMSGQTTDSFGEANTLGGYGGTAAARTGTGSGESAAHARGAAGYGAEQDMDRNIGA